MQVRIILLCLFCMAVSGTVTVANAQSIVSDSEKQKQWKSMENGPWDFAPDWYYFFLHKKYSGAEMYLEMGLVQLRIPCPFQGTQV